jgi:hypothetical protein
MVMSAIGAYGPDDLWLLCDGEPMTDMSAKTLYRSWNGGWSWVQVSRVLVPGPSAPTLPAVGDYDRVVVTSATQAYIVGYRSPVSRTTDGGYHWITSDRPGGRRTDFSSGGLATFGSRQAWAWFVLERHLRATSDAGQHWHRVFARGTRPPRRCRTDDLRAHVVTAGSVASQPFALVALRNAGTSACRLRGYAGVSAVRRRTHEFHGSIYEVADGGPKPIDLMPGQRARFAIGTGAAFGPRVTTVIRVMITVPRSKDALPPLRVDLATGHRPGRRPPLTITAFMHRQPCGHQLVCRVR